MSDLPVSYLTPEECSTAASQTIPLVENGFSNDPVMNGLVPVFKNNAGQLSLSMAISNSSEFTGLIGKADVSFDTAFVSFKDIAASTAGDPTKPEKAKAAQKISSIIEKHGKDLHRRGKVEQIGKWNSLSDELSTPENLKELETAELLDLFNFVKARHAEFVSLYDTRAEAEKENSTIPAPGEAKKPVAENLQDLYTYFQIAAKYVKDYQPTTQKLDEIFSKIVPAARARHSRSLNDKPQKPSPDGTDKALITEAK
jgi:hypothetical protein